MVKFEWTKNIRFQREKLDESECRQVNSGQLSRDRTMMAPDAGQLTICVSRAAVIVRPKCVRIRTKPSFLQLHPRIQPQIPSDLGSQNCITRCFPNYMIAVGATVPIWDDFLAAVTAPSFSQQTVESQVGILDDVSARLGGD